MRWVDKRFWTE